jgi:ribosomal protein S4E
MKLELYKIFNTVHTDLQVRNLDNDKAKINALKIFEKKTVKKIFGPMKYECLGI